MSTSPPDPPSQNARSTHIQNLPELIIVSSSLSSNDPPPPYPSRERRTRTAPTNRRRRTLVQQTEADLLPPGSLITRRSFTGSVEPEYEAHPSPSEEVQGQHHQHTNDPSETTPLLSPSSSSRDVNFNVNGNGPRPVRRQRTLSVSSTVPTAVISLSPSFSETIISAFHPERDADLDPDCSEPDNDIDSPNIYNTAHGAHVDDDGEMIDYPSDAEEEHEQRGGLHHAHPHPHHTISRRLQRYFRPLRIRAYYSALFHLLIVNLPYALIAWLYLFVFTLVRYLLAVAS